MKRIHRVKITTFRRQPLTMPLALVRAHCPACGREVATLEVAQAATVLEVDQAALDSLIALGCVHTLITVSGGRRICQASLFRKE